MAFDPLGKSDLERCKRQAKVQARLLDDQDMEDIEAETWLVSDPTSEHFGREVTANEMRGAVTLAGEGVVELDGQMEHISCQLVSAVDKFKKSRKSQIFSGVKNRF